VTDGTNVQTLPEIEFRGSAEERDLAHRVFALLRATARFYPTHAPIRVPLETLAAHFAETEAGGSLTEWIERLRTALAANDHVFALEATQDGQIIVATTRAGRPPLPPEALIDTAHQLPRRFLEPPPEALTPTKTRPPEEKAAPVAEPAIAAPAEEEGLEKVVAPAATAATVIEDITELSDDELAAAIRVTLSNRPDVVGFADLWAIARIVPSLSRGDVRRIREYIVERGEPLTDREIVEVLFDVRPGMPDYALRQLALNAR
jgi:hypothetical protein